MERICCLTSIQVANFAAYTFAPPVMVTPLGALSVIVGYASFTFHITLNSIFQGQYWLRLCLASDWDISDVWDAHSVF
jgi:predicted membrane metal-binding protein